MNEDKLIINEHKAGEIVPNSDKPVFAINEDEISMYFGHLLKFCYNRELGDVKYKNKKTGRLLRRQQA